MGNEWGTRVVINLQVISTPQVNVTPTALHVNSTMRIVSEPPLMAALPDQVAMSVGVCVSSTD